MILMSNPDSRLRFRLYFASIITRIVYGKRAQYADAVGFSFRFTLPFSALRFHLHLPRAYSAMLNTNRGNQFLS